MRGKTNTGHRLASPRVVQESGSDHEQKHTSSGLHSGDDAERTEMFVVEAAETSPESPQVRIFSFFLF